MKKTCLSQFQKSFLKDNEHAIWFTQRFLVGVMLTLLVFYKQYTYYALIYLFGLGSTFFMWHDGFYYMERDNIKPGTYPDKFKDYSLTSTAEMTYNFETRLILFVIGFFICIFTTYLIN